MLNSLRDGQINYGTTNCPSAHVPPHNVVPSIHQNSHISTEPSTPVYQWNANHRLEHLYGFHSRYYNLDFPTPYPPATNQYVPANVYGQNLPQCCQPCCRLRSQNIPKASPPQVLYNPRPVQQLNRSYKPKKTLKTPCSEQFLPYIPNDLPVKYDTQNCYQQKYNSTYLNNTNYCPPANNLWIPPTANSNWSNDRLRSIGRHSGPVTHDFNRENNYQRLPNYQSNPYSKPTSATHHIPYNYIPPLPDVHDYRPPVYHNLSKNNTTEYVSLDHNSRLPIASQNIQNSSSLQQYYNTQQVPYSDVQIPSESFKPPQITSKDTSKSNLNVREFLATWDEGEEESGEKSSEAAEPIVVLDCMTLDGDALTKIQEKLNVVSYENLEKVLKENQNPLVITTEPNEMNSLNNKPKLNLKSNFEPLDYTKRETGIIKPFVTEKKALPETNPQSEKSYSVNFDGMVAWYGKKNTDISSTDLIERLADRIFNLSKSQENEGVSFGTAAYTGQITQTNRSIESADKNTSKYVQSPQMFDLQHNADKCIEPPIMNKINYNKNSISKVQSFVINESNKASNIKSNNVNSSCIVENITKKCLNSTNEESSAWYLDQGVHEQHLNTSLYDHDSVIMKPLDFSSLTDETKGNPFVFEKLTLNDNKPNDIIDNQCNKAFNQKNSYNSIVSNNQHSIQQIDASNRNFPVIVSPQRQEYNGFHESVIQRTGCDKNKNDKISTQTDFESINWNFSNDLDKIMKNTNMVMEPSCLYDRNNYNILDGMNSDKNISTRWKDNVPCVDLTVNSKPNSHHDSFFDGWSFIESYENYPGKKMMDLPPNANSHHHLFPNQMNPLEEPAKNNNSIENNDTDNTSIVKDIPPFSKSNDILPSDRPSRDVFNLNNRIPDFSDGFELPVINEPQEYLQFKKDDNEHRADGSIFEHLNETKCITTLNDTLNYKNDQNKLDFVGLPSFKEKEPLAPVSAPSKLNIVKPTLRDPSQIYTVIKQKLKYDNAFVDNNSVVTNKTENNSKEHPTNTFNVTDLKSKYNSVQLNQFDVWSEKFVLKGNSNSSSCAVVECDVEITQLKSTPENRNTLPKSNMSENYQDKTMMLPENINRNLVTNKIDIIENDKINSNDFLNCLESTKTDDQKYRDTFDEFETSFGFDIHCNNESNKSFHEDIVDKCFDERINDQIRAREINTVESNNTSDTNTKSSNNTQLPFQCDFQSSFLIKNYFDENKNKAVLDQNETSNREKTDISIFKYHSENLEEFESQNNENIHSVINSVKNPGFNIDCHVEQIHNANDNNNSNFINEVESYKSQHENTINTHKISSTKKNNFDYLNVEDRNFGFDNNKKNIIESEISKETTVVKNSIETNNISQIKHDLNSNKLFQIRKNTNVDFELNIFELNSKSTSKVSQIETNKKHELDRNGHSFDSKLNFENVEKVENNISLKNIFQLDNNNSNTRNLEKIDAFDYNTRIIQNLGRECSPVNIKKATSSNDIFTNESLMETNRGFEINLDKNREKLETNYKNNLGIQEDLKIVETPNLNCNDDTQRNNLIKTENINQEKDVDRIFEIGCIVNNVRDELNLENPKTQTDFDIQNKNTKKNLNNCNSHGNSNMNNNLEVENIFNNIYDNLSTLNTEKNDTHILNNFHQNDMKTDDSKSLEVTEDLNLKNNNSDVVVKIFEESNMDVFHDASDEKFEETDNNSLQELVNNSADCLTTVSIQQNELINDEKCKPALIEYNTKNSNMNENSPMSVKQDTEDIKESEIEQNNDKNRQPVKIFKNNATQDNATLAILENLRSDMLNTVKNTDEKKHTQNNSCESSSLNSFELKSRQNSNEIYEVEDAINSGPCALSHVETTHHQNSIGLIEIKDFIRYGPNLLNHGVSISQQHLIETVEAVDLTSSGSSLLNNDKRRMEKLISENSIDPKFISISHDETTPQQNLKVIHDIEHSMNCESSLINHDELKFQQYSDEKVEIEDSNSSLKHDELKYDKHLNEINEAEDLTRSRPNLINHDELKYHQTDNEISEVDDSSSSGPGSINQNEFKCSQNSTAIYESDDLKCSGSCSINQDELEFQQNANEIYESEDLTRSRPNLINQSELKYYKKVSENEDMISSINQDELELQQNSNSMYESDDLNSSGSCSINQDDLECQPNSKETDKAEDLTRSIPNLINQDELKYHQNVNEISEVDDSISSGPGSINQNELKCPQNSTAIYESDETDKAKDFTRSSASSINQGELKYHRNLNEINDIKYSISFGPSSINQDESELQQNSNETDKAKDFTTFVPSLTNQGKIKFKNNSSEINEAVDLTVSRPNLLNCLRYESCPNLNKSVKDEDSIDSVGSVLNSNELICQKMHVEPYNINNSAVSEHNIHETNHDSCTKETDSISVADDIQLPRVKFILKCKSRNMVKRNIFDEESTVPYKKMKVVKDEKIMTQYIFKKRNAYFKQYKPLQKIYRKESIVESNDENLIKSTETMSVLPTTSFPVNSEQEVLNLDEEIKNHHKFVSFLDQTYGKRDTEALNISVGVEDDAMDGGDYNGTLQTPIPSPFSDFQSEDDTPEHCGGEVYWDKSLEDEYKSVLHKTISKLVKVRANVRDKFNSRLLARRMNEAKRRRRKRLLVTNKEAVVIVGRIDDTIKPVIAAVKVSTNPMYKIKVQLPWRRIFNMNAVRNKTKDTKIELGPAKVEVRLSRTPGEWQIAACRSMTSPKSMLVVRRLVLQRATSPAENDSIVDDHQHNQRHDDSDHGTNDNRPYEFSRKLPKIVIRRNGQDNNYTSYVSSCGFEIGGCDKDVGGDKDCGGGDDENNGGNCVPQLMVRLVRNRKLDAMAVEGVTTLHLKHLVPISESEGEAAMELDMHCAKSVQYS